MSEGVTGPTSGSSARPSPVVVAWHLTRVVLGCLFITSGALKVADPGAFLEAIETFQLIPYPVAYATAVFLPWLEIVCGIALISIRFAPAGSLICCNLLVVFVLMIALSWARGLDITCGCFGKSDNATNYPWLIGRNLLLLGGSAFVATIHYSGATWRRVLPTNSPAGRRRVRRALPFARSVQEKVPAQDPGEHSRGHRSASGVTRASPD